MHLFWRRHFPHSISFPCHIIFHDYRPFSSAGVGWLRVSIAHTNWWRKAKLGNVIPWKFLVTSIPFGICCTNKIFLEISILAFIFLCGAGIEAAMIHTVRRSDLQFPTCKVTRKDNHTLGDLSYPSKTNFDCVIMTKLIVLYCRLKELHCIRWKLRGWGKVREEGEDSSRNPISGCTLLVIFVDNLPPINASHTII